MFQRLTDFSFQRSGLQAVGFYLFYFLISVLISGLVGAVVAGSTAKTTEEGFAVGLRLGPVVATIYSLVLSGAILVKKRRMGHPGYLIVMLVCAVGAIVLGALLGVLGPAYLSTRPSSSPR